MAQFGSLVQTDVALPVIVASATGLVYFLVKLFLARRIFYRLRKQGMASEQN